MSAQARAVPANDAPTTAVEQALARAQELRTTYDAAGYVGVRFGTAQNTPVSPAQGASVSVALEMLAMRLTEALEPDPVWPVEADPRPVDLERLARLRRIGRSEGNDLTAWYASMLDEADR
jgi:hypothetical protein